jgi:hypothetical protein
VSTHFTGLRIGYTFDFQDARHAKEHVLELVSDSESEEEVEGTKYVVKPCHSVKTGVYKNTTPMAVLILERDPNLLQ